MVLVHSFVSTFKRWERCLAWYFFSVSLVQIVFLSLWMSGTLHVTGGRHHSSSLRRVDKRSSEMGLVEAREDYLGREVCRPEKPLIYGTSAIKPLNCEKSPFVNGSAMVIIA